MRQRLIVIVHIAATTAVRSWYIAFANALVISVASISVWKKWCGLAEEQTGGNSNDLPALVNNNAIAVTSLVSIATVSECSEHFNASKVRVHSKKEQKKLLKPIILKFSFNKIDRRTIKCFNRWIIFGFQMKFRPNSWNSTQCNFHFHFDWNRHFRKGKISEQLFRKLYAKIVKQNRL